MKEGRTAILAIESSCDETAAAVVLDGREAASNVISSQIEIHKAYGGVVPEIASRHHLDNINPVVEQAMEEAEEGNFEEAYEALEEARKALVEGHQAHTDILHVDGTEGVEVTLLIVHASNHLSNAEMSIDFAERIIKLYERGGKNA